MRLQVEVAGEDLDDLRDLAVLDRRQVREEAGYLLHLAIRQTVESRTIELAEPDRAAEVA